VRAGLFILLGACAGTPLLYLTFSPDKNKLLYSRFDMTDWLIGGAFYLGGAIFYARRIPEKYYP